MTETQKIELSLSPDTKKLLGEFIDGIYAFASALKGIPVPYPDKQETPPQQEEPKETPQQSIAPLKTEDAKEVATLKTFFSDELLGLIDIKFEGDNVIVKPRKFLGSDNFAKIASVVKGVGGEYVSAGRNSHFCIPKNKLV